MVFLMSLPSCSYNGQQITTIVARFSGLANDSNSRSSVLDCINIGLFEIANSSPWSWNELTNSSISIVAGTSDYNLPTGAGQVFEDIYDVRMTGGNARTLDALDQRTYDRFRRLVQNTQNIPTHYTIFSKQQGGTISLLPTPNISDTLSIKYTSRQAIISDATASSLAMSDHYLPIVIFKGCENVALWKNPEKAMFWAGKYKIAVARGIETDRNGPDSTPGLIPQVDWVSSKVDAVNPTDLDFYPRG
jgi:hypothetical protein